MNIPENAKKLMYSISIAGYVQNWGRKQIVRELVSNARDSVKDANGIVNGKYNFYLKDNTFYVEDNAVNGLKVKQLIVGVSEKSSQNAIGQFGEGLKLSMIVALRLGMEFSIISQNLRVEAQTELVEDVEVLCLYYWTEDTYYEGTKIVITNWNSDETFKELFLDEDDPRIWMLTPYGEVLGPKDGEENTLFVKRVKIQNIPNFYCSYECPNITLGRDRDASSWQIYEAVGKIWSSLDNPNGWKFYFQICEEGKAESRIDIDIYNMKPAVKEAMKKGFKLYYGEKTVLDLDKSTKLNKMVEHKGFEAVSPRVGSEMLNALSTLFENTKAFVDRTYGKKAFEVKKSDLSYEEKANMRFLERLGAKVAEHYGITMSFMVAKLDDADGEATVETGLIKFDPRALQTRGYALDVFIHEVGHMISKADDLTDSHLNACTKLASELVLTIK